MQKQLFFLAASVLTLAGCATGEAEETASSTVESVAVVESKPESGSGNAVIDQLKKEMEEKLGQGILWAPATSLPDASST